MPGDIQQVHREVVLVEPFVAKSIATELATRNTDPVRADLPHDRWRQRGLDILGRFGELRHEPSLRLVERVPGLQELLLERDGVDQRELALRDGSQPPEQAAIALQHLARLAIRQQRVPTLYVPSIASG